MTPRNHWVRELEGSRQSGYSAEIISGSGIQDIQPISRNCVIPIVCVRTLGSVGSQTQLCHWGVILVLYIEKQIHVSAYDGHLQVVLGVLKSYCKLYHVHNVEISKCLVSRCDKAQINPQGPTPPKGYTETRRNTPTPRAQVCCSKLYTPRCRETSLGNKLN